MAKGSYWAFVLDEESRNQLLMAVPAKFQDIITHHVTLAFGVPENAYISDGQGVVITPVWEYFDDSLQAVVVRVEGYGLKRPDGKDFHITLSLDKSKGRKPVHSNELIAKYDRTTYSIPIIGCPVLTGTLQYC